VTTMASECDVPVREPPTEHAAVRRSSDRPGREQIHVWLRDEDARLLRRIASERDQTLSGAVRHLLRAVRRIRSDG
jgi:hypothetical protein